jgi:Ca2+-binding RTX toxin-like protein
MPNFIITGADDVSKTLAFGETGVVTSTGALSSDFIAITATGYALITIQGSVASLSASIQLDNGAQVVIGRSGVINAGSEGIYANNAAAGSATTIANAGTILGASGVISLGRSLTLNNTGEITAYEFNGVGSDVADGLQLTNSGMIGGRNWGVSSNNSADADNIINTGTISGGIGAMTLGANVSVIRNTGVLAGLSELGDGDDLFNGSGGIQGDVLGQGGKDTLRGGDYDDVLYGGTGDDLLRGGQGDDLISGNENSDIVFGGGGDDNVFGGAGVFADSVRGGMGDDTLTGGGGADTFIFLRNHGTDRITDFVNNTDKLDLSAFDFSSVAAVTALASASSQGVRIDLPGDGILFVTGITLAQLSASDVIL